jgi:osmotically-inducible protein OsmY
MMQRLATLQTDFEDRDLERRVVNYLAGRHVPGLRHLSVQARAGTVTLRGRVQTFYEKQLCQDCCRRVAGVVQLVDAVDVAYSQPAVASLA